MDFQVGPRQGGRSALRPLRHFKSGAGKDVAKAGIFPFARIGEAIKVEVPNSQVRQLVRLHYGVGWTLDASRQTERVQQMAHQRGLARAQVAMQLHKAVQQRWAIRQALRKLLGVGFAAPQQRSAAAGAFYNRRVTHGSIQINNTPEAGSSWFEKIQIQARELGFSQIGVAGVDLTSAEPGLLAWLERGFHGDMAYMATHGLKRARPAELVPGTVSVITARMDYLPGAMPEDWQMQELARLQRPAEAIVSIYARGRDYHKVLRSRLQKLTDRIQREIGPLGHRVFTDSAPVLEVELASRSGQGWRGKHTLMLNREAGSMFFLGEIFVAAALPASSPVSEHCGRCRACIDVCPTQAIVAPYRLDARRCISYLTIEHQGAIPLELRALVGNRIYGCDDCQVVCPWNKFAQRSALPDFDERAGLSGQQLLTLFAWNEEDFMRHTEGSPIRRIGHGRWLRNIAVALGNALRSGAEDGIRDALTQRLDGASELLREHLLWALAQ